MPGSGSGGFMRGFVGTSLELMKLQEARRQFDARQEREQEQLKLLKKRLDGEAAAATLKQQEALGKIKARAALGTAIAGRGPLGQTTFSAVPDADPTGDAPRTDTGFAPELAAPQQPFAQLGRAVGLGADLPDKLLTQLLGGDAPGEPFTLGQDQVRFSASGQEIARGPAGTRAQTPESRAYQALLERGVDPVEALGIIDGRRKSPTEASMALEAAGGDPDKALGLLRQQRTASRAQTTITINEKRELQKEQERSLAGRVTQDIQRVLGLLGSAQLPTTGAVGSFIAKVPGTAAADIRFLLDGIKANIGFRELQQMRQASPTGGALGSITEKELALLQATLGSLEQAQSQEQFVFNLHRIHDQFLDVIHGPGQGPARLGGGTPRRTGGAPPRTGTATPQAAPLADPLGIR